MLGYASSVAVLENPQLKRVTVQAGEVAINEAQSARRSHYADFYSPNVPTTGFGLIVGNCQAESLRIVLDSEELPLLRIPPVHELDAADVERLHVLISHADALVSQPIRNDYHGLRLGTSQLNASLPRGSRSATIPVVRYTGLHPFQLAMHVEGVDESPPMVAYHDVRVLAAAAGISLAGALRPRSVRAVAADSLAELRRREAELDVTISDLFDQPDFAEMRTVNHPGNRILMTLGDRVLTALGPPATATDPGRPLLNAVHAPREEWVIDAWGAREEPRRDWIVDGAIVDRKEVAEAHRGWYARHPAFVHAALDRIGPLLRRWPRRPGAPLSL